MTTKNNKKTRMKESQFRGIWEQLTPEQKQMVVIKFSEAVRASSVSMSAAAKALVEIGMQLSEIEKRKNG